MGGETCDQGAHFESPDELPMEHVLDHADPFSEMGCVKWVIRTIQRLGQTNGLSSDAIDMTCKRRF